MEVIQLASFQENIHSIIDTIIHSHQPVLISDKGQFLVKVIPLVYSEPGSWLGCMRDTGKITGDIVAPAEDAQAWDVLAS